jgi:hypothetical protein
MIEKKIDCFKISAFNFLSTLNLGLALILCVVCIHPILQVNLQDLFAMDTLVILGVFAFSFQQEVDFKPSTRIDFPSFSHQ